MILSSDLHIFPEPLRPIVVSMHNDVVRLREENARLRRAMYGSTSERHVPGEIIEPCGSLFNEAEAIATGAEGGASDPEPAPPPPPTKKPRVRSPKSGGRDEFPADLPRTVVVVDVSDEEKICPADGAPLEKIGERIVEKLNIEPAKITVTQYVYPSYSCPVCKDTVVQAPAVPSALPSSACEPALLAYILTQKYGFGLPLYRIEQQLAQLGVTVSRAKMARWVIAAADALGDVAFEIKAHILGQAAIHADETTVQVLKGTGKTPTSKSYMWTLCTAEGTVPAVWFQHAPSRDKVAAARLLEKFAGLLHIDGFEGYAQTVERNDITRVGCWAHVRRYFDTAKKDGAPSGKPLSGEFLDDIQLLFLAERDWVGLAPEERLAGRLEKSKPIVDRIKQRLDDERYNVPPKSKLGAALTYLANQWETLVVFLADGRASLSNNRMENHIRPFAVGRKNWLFSDTSAGADASALIYSIVGTAKANGTRPQEYLTWLLTELPEAEARPRKGKLDLEPFMPWSYAETVAAR